MNPSWVSLTSRVCFDSDVSAGDFDIQFAYNGLQWDTGDASGGVDGLANTDGNPAYPARAGYSNGTGDAGTSFGGIKGTGGAPVKTGKE